MIFLVGELRHTALDSNTQRLQFMGLRLRNNVKTTLRSELFKINLDSLNICIDKFSIICRQIEADTWMTQLSLAVAVGNLIALSLDNQ